jgi:hypothetical protein
MTNERRKAMQTKCGGSKVVGQKKDDKKASKKKPVNKPEKET